MRRKWERYGKRLQEDDGDGSLIGAPFIIAESGVTDVLALLASLDAALARVTLLEAALEDAIHDWLSCDDPTARARQIQRIYDNQVHGWTMHLSPMACAEALLTVRAWSDEDNNDSVSDAALDGGE